MAEVQNVNKVVEYLKAAIEKYVEEPDKKKVTVIVGYTQAYAIYVHENLESHHPIGQAKFLEEPAREFSSRMLANLYANMKKKMSFGEALLIAGLRLQRMSQKLVPLDTGALKNSAFTRKETS